MAAVNNANANLTGSVMVVGAGISGMQAALDLAGAGYKVFLVEKSPSIGGKMPMLDKTFPTNDCSMCIASPKLVECGRHHNIDIFTCSEVTEISGSPGNFQVTVNKQPRFVDEDKCLGCGECEEACPVDVSDDFNQSLNDRRAIYRLYPQAYPNAYLIDRENCIECGACEDACPAGAIDHDMEEENFYLDVGAVLLCPGYELFDAKFCGEYGYGIYENVVTSLQLERMLSASGPYQGHVQKSDGNPPRKIAFIQCVGSRDSTLQRGYCSSVCCMYATKEAMIAREHLPGLETSIFCMDIRAFGKGYEQYYRRASSEYGINYVKCMISSIKELPDKTLRLRYRAPDRSMTEEDFDLVVLSVGLKPSADSIKLARQLGIELNDYNFCRTGELSPVRTSREGFYVAGVFSGPKDIPETVTEASAAAAEIAAYLAPARGTETTKKEFPPEKDVAGDVTRTGVFVCHCGINIGSVVDVPGVTEYARTLPGVAYATDRLYACSQDSSAQIKDAIAGHNLNRVVVASCSPRTHEPLFQETLQEAGLNPNLLEMANIRDQCSWVHMNEPEKATAKAKDLVSMAAAKVARLEPVKGAELEINRDVLVIGGGIAGLTSALNLAEQGYRVNIVEKDSRLGGNARRLSRGVKGEDVQKYLSGLIDKVNNSPLVNVYTGTGVENVSGFVGNYTAELATGEKIPHGAVIIATGADEHRPGKYLYGQDSRVMTALELEEAMAAGDGRIDGAGSFVFIQCAGSRDCTRTYCSRVCCAGSMQRALRLKENKPDAAVYVLYRDIRTYGFLEELYWKARQKGVIFIRYREEEKPEVKAEGESLQVTVTDSVLRAPVLIEADLVVLAAAIVPPGENNHKLSKLYKVPLNEDGFFLEAHMKLRPVDFDAGGVFMAGLAHSPKNLEENIAQARAAAGRASTLLARDTISIDGKSAVVNKNKCSGCGTCEEVCPAGAIRLDASEGTAVVNEVLCKGCGVCASSCRCGAVNIRGCSDGQIAAMLGTL